MLAISQTNAKKVLAYSTISNLGLIIACAGINTSLALAAAVALIIFHAVSKGLLFMSAGVIEHRIWSREIEDMEGLLVKMPLTAVVTLVGILSMLLPPFGVLIAKWAAIEASVHLPLAMLLVVGGSAFTVVFWTKWMGRILATVPGARRFRFEKLHRLYAAPLVALGVGAGVLSAFIAPLVGGIIAPAVAQYYAAAGFVTEAGQLVSDIGAFPVWPIFVVILLAALVPLLLVRVRRHEVRPVYMCGEHMDDGVGTVNFRSPAEQVEELHVGGYYFDHIFGESKLTRWVNPVAVALIVVALGVAL